MDVDAWPRISWVEAHYFNHVPQPLTMSGQDGPVGAQGSSAFVNATPWLAATRALVETIRRLRRDFRELQH